MFFISAREGQKLKTYSATSRAGKHIIKIEVEYSRAIDMAMDIEGLEAVVEEQKPKPKPRKAAVKPKQIERTTRLALPAPGDVQ